MRKRALFALSVTLTGIGCAGAAPYESQKPAARIDRVPGAVAARIDALMRRAVDHQQLPGVSVAIGRLDGTILYANGYGYRDLARQAPADRETVYNIASITKQFTAASILLLAQERRLKIDDPVAKYLPAIPYAGRISLRDLMTHTSGIPDYFCLAGYRPGMSATDIVRLSSSQPLHFDPGTAYEYSNTNYVLLGLVIERVAGSSYAAFVRRRLLEPAHMRSSRIGDVPSEGSDDARGYTSYDAGPVVLPATEADLGYGAGAIDSTVVDLVKWNALLFGRSLLDDAHLHEMLSARSYGPATTVLYGLGLHERRGFRVRELYHRGRNEGYGGISATFPDDGIAIELLANNERFAPMFLVDELRALFVRAPRSTARASRVADAPADPKVDARAKRWLRGLADGNVDPAEMSAAARRRYSAAAVASQSARIKGFGQLQGLTLLEKDSRCLGWDYTYRAVFRNAVVEYRFGLGHDGRVWNATLDRED